MANPPYTASGASGTGPTGLYVVALMGYPLQGWLDTLTLAGVEILDPLPPAAYIVRGDRKLIEGLKGAMPFVRGVFRMGPEMKTEAFETIPAGPSPFRRLVVDAVEDSAASSLRPALESVAESGAVVELERRKNRVQYSAAISDVDAWTIASFESVLFLSPTSEAAPSSERQAWLVAQPTISGGQITLPAAGDVTCGDHACADYKEWLAHVCTDPSHCISDFSNTRVALVDTGFDDLTFGNHPDFTLDGNSTVITSYGAQAFNQTTEPNVDNLSHGTVTTSIVTAWPPTGTTRKDREGYRYAFGLAPTVPTAVDKFFAAGSGNYSGGNEDPNVRLTNALTDLSSWVPNVINHSWNSRPACAYENISQQIDRHTRIYGVLHVVAAGNTDDQAAGGCPNVRAPATARNAIAVGATENFTLGPADGWLNYSGATGYVASCDDDYFPLVQDARNIAHISAQQYASALIDPVKPDVVAPGLRVTGPLSREETWQNLRPAGTFCSTSDLVPPADGISYRLAAGTSFAAPVVSGAAAVVRKWYANAIGYPWASPSPALTKAMIINGARDIAGGRVRQIASDSSNPSSVCSGGSSAGTPCLADADCPGGFCKGVCFGGPNAGGSCVSDYGCPQSFCNGALFAPIADEHQGFGMVSFARLLDSPSNHYWVEQGAALTPNSPLWVGYPIVSDWSKDTRITLVYTDRYSVAVDSPYYLPVNNLNLTVCYVGGFACWHGNHWSGSGTTFITSPTDYFNDNRNNVKEVVIPAGYFNSGQQIFVQVTATTLAGDGVDPDGTTLRQDFALFGTNIH